ncbi:MAG TPA: hypothetical protein VLU43_08890 [Anaeromyxobacteraceae bacterium]|nr:hypothetical protein [Anaeromyxobacteraceae bacterium]
MSGAVPVLVALALSSPPDPARNAAQALSMGTLEPSPPRLRVPAVLVPPLVVQRSATADAKLEDVCFGDYCPPRVAVEGYGPTFDADARKIELALSVLRQVGWAPLTRVVEVCAATGLALDVRPGQMEALSGRATHGWGEARVFFRWRLDPFGRPTWALRGP